MRIAIVHDWLVTAGGAEKVLAALLKLYPEADLYSVVEFLPEGQREFLEGRPVRTSFIQRLPFARRRYRTYLPLMPIAVEQFDLSAYDLVISSSYAVAKGVLTGPDQLHVSYVHSPMRYAWDLQHQYLRQSSLDRGLKSWVARWLLHQMRMWDVRTAAGVDHFVVNSRFIARRVRKTYRREATVIHPPVDVARFVPREGRDDFYLTASRLVPYKRVDLIVEAFARMPDRRLVVIGDGPEEDRIRALAGPNVEFMGFVADDVIRERMARARAFVYAAEEDFGIVPVEAQACGTPVVAYGKGGALETVRASHGTGVPPTGRFFARQDADDIVRAVDAFEADREEYDPEAIRAHALTFSEARFLETFGQFVEACWHNFRREAFPGVP